MDKEPSKALIDLTIGFLAQLQNFLTNARRVGHEQDAPEGSRVVIISDTLAIALAGAVESLLVQFNAPAISPAKPDCYECQHRNNIPGNAHSSCANPFAKVTGNEHGIINGWFYWPWNFDPIWLTSCTAFTPIKQNSQNVSLTPQPEE